MKKFLLFAIFLVSLSFLISNVKAVTYISGCSNLDQEGETYYLTQDIIDYPDTCMYVSASYVTLDCQGHIIDGVPTPPPQPPEPPHITNGIYAYGVNNITIKNCFLTDWENGLYLSFSSYNKIIDSTFETNTYAIRLEFNSNNQIINSIIISNPNGIFIQFSSNNQIINSTANFNSDGIYIQFSPNNQIINSTANFNSYRGIFIQSSSNNQIINSTINSNSNWGIHLYYGSETKIINSIINSNHVGIYLQSSSDNQIINSIINFNNYGIHLSSSQNNLIYNNLFNNTNNFYFTGIYSNYWNTTKQSGQRIYSPGNYIGGNYWTNPEGNGYSDICTDDDRDGFCDLPYDLLGDGTNVDYLPLSDKYAPNLPPEITIFSPLNQSYYGSIDFAFKATDDFDENFTVRTYLNNRLEYENLYYQNNTQISYSKSLPIGIHNFTVYAEDSFGASSQQEVIFTSLGYCGDNVCQADYENSANCFKDCGGASKNFVFLVVVGLGIMGIVFGRDLVVGTKTTEEMVRTFVVILIILVVIGIIASTWL